MSIDNIIVVSLILAAVSSIIYLNWLAKKKSH
jgi:hypothetical protein